MKFLGVFLILTTRSVLASEGDHLPEFSDCWSRCSYLLNCDGDPHGYGLKRSVGLSNSGRSEEDKYEKEYFLDYESLSGLTRFIFRWDCSSDCNYKCQQIITNKRLLHEENMVQFYGKWPFKRVLGMQELPSVLFSVANFYANYSNLFKILYQYRRNSIQKTQYVVMYQQYLILIMVSLVGWMCSALFHARDSAFTETLDYFGAALIILSNFTTIVMRYFNLFELGNSIKLRILRGSVFTIFVIHCIRLYLNWNYRYNVLFNLIFGLAASILWILHSFNVNKVFVKDNHIYNSSIQLLPHETKILAKLSYISISKTSLIPLIPIFLNIWIICGLSFELLDFAPIWRLVDAHAIWHLFTIFPSMIWFDWNIWDIEMHKVSSSISKQV
ncbi:uncharacterized protein PRCAT00003575001 [Priceomyces carsonii]|uniref:uncharacterized protein n=1 Tax=Priceomyces carsonii TaxID=28549 RepID=UPI002ED9BD61|nr:unnamed protein product [Priceomyces carsonii]